jgi:hypothetical protein
MSYTTLFAAYDDGNLRQASVGDTEWVLFDGEQHRPFSVKTDVDPKRHWWIK